ncbi:MAG: hypothetical protein Q8P20_04175 [bacterium]|nr:hypothetical protein [bacterium]
MLLEIFFPVGTNVINCTATDSDGNVGTNAFIITVILSAGGGGGGGGPIGAIYNDFGIDIVNTDIALGDDDIRVIISKIINIFLGFLGIISFSLVVYAGFKIFTARGDEQQIAEGKKFLISGSIGLAIVLSSFALVSFLFPAFL